jgi:hypothetical protein
MREVVASVAIEVRSDHVTEAENGRAAALSGPVGATGRGPPIDSDLGSGEGSVCETVGV